MKKTLFVTMLATALMGGQVFADPTGTAIDGASYTQGTNYYGAYSETESVTGGNVTIKADDTGEVPGYSEVYGGFSKVADASNNTVVMTGGKVWAVYGGRAKSDNKEASNNVVIVTAGTMGGTLYAGYANSGGTLMNNKVHLVGKGASNVRIADAQGNISTYSGGTTGISLSSVRVVQVGMGTAEGNSIDIYGTGITIGSMSMQILTFNITDGQLAGQNSEAALSLTATSSSSALNLEGVALQVNDLDVKKWTPGTTITLVEAKVAIQGLSDPKEVNIMRGDVVTATGTLKLNEDNTQLLLTNIKEAPPVPEPMTGTLSLLALAGLCVRRRRK